MGTGESLKETKNMIEGENDKQVSTSMGEPLKKKYMFRDKNGNRVRTCGSVVSTGKLGN